jgi:uncharacterized repeat protein (TIGR01451 family)
MRLLRILALVALVLAFMPAPAVAVTGYDSAYAGESAFVTISPGETANFQVFFMNTGTLTWTRGTDTQVDLAACLSDKVTCNAQDPADAPWNSGWMSTVRYATTTQAAVAPRAVSTFSYNIKAPSNATAGTNRFNGDLVVARTGERIHPEGYFQDATIEAIGAVASPTPTPVPPAPTAPPTPTPTPTPLGTLTVNDSATATGCPGEAFTTTFEGSGLAANTDYELVFTRTAPPPAIETGRGTVTTDAAGTFTEVVPTTGAEAPSTYSVVVELDGTPRTNPVTVNFVCGSDVSVTKTDTPDPVVAGSNITYTITVTNNGTTAAEQVSLSDAIPANTTFVSFAAPTGWQTQTPAAGGTGTVIARTPSLDADATATFTLVVNVNASTAGDATITNTATVNSASTDTNPANNSDTETTSVTAAPNPLLCFDGPDVGIENGDCTLIAGGATLDATDDDQDPNNQAAGVYYERSGLNGQLLAAVDTSNVSFDYAAAEGTTASGGSPRFSIPIDEAGSGSTNAYAFIDTLGCNDGSPDNGTLSLSDTTCIVTYGSESHINWAAFAAAHPTWRVSSAIPFVVADQPGFWTVTNVHIDE